MNLTLFENWMDIRILLGAAGILLAIIFLAYWTYARRRQAPPYRDNTQETMQPKPSKAEAKPHLNEDSEIPVNQDAPNTSYSANDKQQQ